MIGEVLLVFIPLFIGFLFFLVHDSFKEDNKFVAYFFLVLSVLMIPVSTQFLSFVANEVIDSSYDGLISFCVSVNVWVWNIFRILIISGFGFCFIWLLSYLLGRPLFVKDNKGDEE